MPVYVLAPERVSVPLPFLINDPDPLITPEYAYALLRLMMRVPLLVMFDEAGPKLPVVPPLPICSVPAEMVVVPVYVLSPVKISVPAPDLVTEMGPDITPLYS